MKAELLENDLSHKKRNITDVIRFIKTRNSDVPNYTLLLGAGCSVTSGIKSARVLIDEWQKELFQIDAENKDKEYTLESVNKYFDGLTKWYDKNNQYSSLFEKKYDLPRQRRIFVEEQVAGKKPSIGYAYLMRLIHGTYFNTVFTTNFDDLLNESFNLFSHYSSKRPIVCAHDSSVRSVTITSDRPKIIKLHGDYLYDDIKSTLRETESLQENVRNKLVEFCKEFGLIVVGYAGNDRSVMDVINYLLKSEEYFKHGIYWCIRKGDEVSDEVRKLLWRDRVYFVYIDGFDELFAEFYHEITGFDNPPLPKLFSSRTEIIQSFIDNKQLTNSAHPKLRKAIEALGEEVKKNTIFEMLKDTFSDTDKIDDELTNEELEPLLDAQSLLAQKEYSVAIGKIENQLHSSENGKVLRRKLKELLIRAYLETDRQDLAIHCCDDLIRENPKAVKHYLIKTNLVDNLYDKIAILEKAIDVDAYDYRIYEKVTNALSQILRLRTHHITRNEDLKIFLNMCDLGIEKNPSIMNDCWREKFFALKNLKEELSVSWKKDCLNIVNESEKQNKNHYVTFKLKLDLLEPEQKEEAKCLYNDAKKAMQEKEEEAQAPFLAILIELVDDFRLSALYKDIETIIKNSTVFEKETNLLTAYALFIAKKYGNIISAIDYLEKALKIEVSYRIVVALMRYYFYCGDKEKTNDLFNKYKCEFDSRKHLMLEMVNAQCQEDYIEEKNIFTKLERYLKYEDEFLTQILYNCLIRKDYKDVLKIGKEFLEKNNYNRFFESVIINFELAKYITKDKKVNVKRLSEVKESSKEEMTKAACSCLLGETDDVVKYLSRALEESVTYYFDIKEFPVFDYIRDNDKYLKLMTECEEKLSLKK